MQQRTGPVYAVGDVHGCRRALDGLLDLVQADATRLGIAHPRVVFLGDLVDRGPDARRVLDLLTDARLASRMRAETLLGNHDAWMLAVLDAQADAMLWLRNGGAETVESYGIGFERGVPGAISRFRASFPSVHRAFIAKRPLLHFEGELVFSHAGLDPARPMNAQQADTVLWGKTGFLESARDYGHRVVHGHWVSERVQVLPNRIGLDTGAGFPGGRLSAAVIEPDGEVRVIGVPAD